MKELTPGRPRVDSSQRHVSEISKFLDENWDVKVGRTNEDVASELGYKSPNMISMLRMGRSKVALPRLLDLSRLMRVGIGTLLPLWFKQELEDNKALSNVIMPFILADNEIEVMQVIRAARGKDRDSAYSEQMVEAIKKVISDPAAREKLMAGA